MSIFDPPEKCRPDVCGPARGVYNLYMRHVRLILACVCLFLAAPACADIVHLKTGSKLEGEIIERADGIVRIRMSSGIIATVKEEDVVAIEQRQTPRDVYEAMARKVQPNDSDAHFALAMWCRDHGLQDETTAEIVATLKTNPDHEGARRELGHVRTEQGWMSREDAMRAEGKILVKGRWVTKEEADRIEKKEREKRLILAINAAVYKIHSSSKAARAEQEAKLATFDDPSMAWKIVGLLDDRDVAVRRAACRSLAAMKHREGINRLVRVTLSDTDETVREAALGALLAMDRGRACDAFCEIVAALKIQNIANASEQRGIERLYYRIASALDKLDDVRAVPFLIEILYPNVDITGRPGGEQEAGVGLGISSGSLSEDFTDRHTVIGLGEAQPLPPERDAYYFNEAAETALKRFTGQDLGVLPEDWRKWWKEHGEELLRKAEAERRGGQEKADQLLQEKAGET